MPAATKKGPKILMVDDDRLTCNALTYAFQRRGAAVDVTPTAEGALGILSVEKPEILVVDLILAGKMDGYELIERVKADPNLKTIAVFILTNRVLKFDENRAQEVGAVGLLVKAHLSINEIADRILASQPRQR